MTQKSELGRWGEDRACEYLVENGYKVIERNFRRKWGELDIVAKYKDGMLVFVEVKTVENSDPAGIAAEDQMTTAKDPEIQESGLIVCRPPAGTGPRQLGLAAGSYNLDKIWRKFYYKTLSKYLKGHYNESVMALTTEQIKEFEAQLLAAKKEIENDIEKMKADLDFGDDLDHMDEEADETEEMTKFMGVKKPLEEKMAAIDASLERIKKGTYGRCERCGKEIELEVLRVAPESSLCRSCKMK